MEIPEQFDSYLRKGIDLNTKDDDQDAPLHLAAQHKNLDTLQTLLALGADVNVKDKHGNTPLLRAILGRNIHSTHVLIMCGADINASDSNGNTTLHKAVCFANREIVDILIVGGASIHSKNQLGVTPLDVALRFGRINVMQEFLDRGGDVNAKDNCGNTLLHKAANIGNIATVQFLIDQGASVDEKNDKGNTPIHSTIDFMLLNSIHKFLSLELSSLEREHPVLNIFQKSLFERPLRQIAFFLNYGGYDAQVTNRGDVFKIQVSQGEKRLEVEIAFKESTVNLLVRHEGLISITYEYEKFPLTNSPMIELNKFDPSQGMDVLRALLAKMPDLNQRTIEHLTPLELAKSYEKKELIREMLDSLLKIKLTV